MVASVRTTKRSCHDGRWRPSSVFRFPGLHDIETMIKAGIPDAEVTIRDLAGDGDHYAADVVSESFRGKTRVQQHQMVYQALQGNMGGVLHALALQTSAPK